MYNYHTKVRQQIRFFLSTTVLKLILHAFAIKYAKTENLLFNDIVNEPIT